MNESGILKLSGFIAEFTQWDDLINACVMEFKKKYNVYPNIFTACDETYRKIDLYAQKHPNWIYNPDKKETIETCNEPYEGISAFKAVDYSLEFCTDNKLEENAFVLIFDETPDFDGKPEDIQDEPDNVIRYRKIA